MAGKYLDRDAVLKALEKTRDWPAYTIAEFQEAVKHGKFDANPTPFGREWMREQDIVVAEKDAEIARLSKTIDEIMNDNLHMRVEIERKIQEIERLNEKYNESCADKEALAEVIRKLSNALASEKWVNEDLKEACEEHEREIARLKSRIADLEKLCDVQKTTIDAQGKEIAEPETSQKKVIDGVVLHGIATLSGNIPVCNTREHIIIHDVDYV